jgi:hypothetical protein
MANLATRPATPRMMPLPLIRLTFGSVGCVLYVPECIERSAIVDKFESRMWLDLPWILKDAVLPVDLRAFAMWFERSNGLQTCKRMQAPVETCRNPTSFFTFLFCSWHLLSLQSCNGWQSHVVAKRQMETMVGNQFSFLAFLVNFVGWVGTKIDCLPFSEWRRGVLPWPPVWLKYLGQTRTPKKFEWSCLSF